MSFPRAPNKKIKGGLKLSIRPPLSVEVENELPDPTAVDYATGLKLRVPLGLKLDNDVKDSFRRQKDTALLRLFELKTKSKNCKHCDNFTDYLIIDDAEQLVNYLYENYSNKITQLTTIIIGHQAARSGIITIEFLSGQKFFRASIEKAGIIIFYDCDNPYPTIVDNPRSEELLRCFEGW